jgi:YHS domain-containing protein
MIEILSLAIARQETEEEFFRRSSEASTNEVAKALFTEIAEDLAAYRQGLEKRKKKLMDAKEDLGRHPGVSEAVKICIEGTCDPVCGMRVDESKSEYTSTYEGNQYYFCSADCKKAFDLNPEKYLRDSE